jgi:hypothetical protein
MPEKYNCYFFGAKKVAQKKRPESIYNPIPGAALLVGCTVASE